MVLTKADSKERIRLGYWCSGQPPYGYRLNSRGLLFPNAEESSVIRDIFDMYDSGVSMRAIADTLTKSGVHPPSSSYRRGVTPLKKWHESAVRRIVNRREFYKAAAMPSCGEMFDVDTRHEEVLHEHVAGGDGDSDLHLDQWVRRDE